MKKLHYALAGLLILGALVSGAPSANAAEKRPIGYVDLQRAIREVEDGKRAEQKLKAIFEKKQAALREKEKELEAMKNRIEAKGSEQRDPSEVREFQKKFLALQEILVKERNALKKLEGKELSKITKKLRRIIRQIGKKGNYLLIMEAQESSLLFAQAHLDLTNEVIRKYNAGNRRKK